MDPQARSVLVEGEVLSGPRLEAYAARNGLCPKCCITSTHKRIGTVFNFQWQPLTSVNQEGDLVVYKGYCLHPTCHTLLEAQELLGEKTPKVVRKSKHKNKRKPPAGGKSTFSPSSSPSPSPAFGRKLPARMKSTTSSRSFNVALDGSSRLHASFSGFANPRSPSGEQNRLHASLDGFDADARANALAQQTFESQRDVTTKKPSPPTPPPPPPPLDGEDKLDLSESAHPPLSPTTLIWQQLEDAYATRDVPMILQILQTRFLEEDLSRLALEYLRKSLHPADCVGSDVTNRKLVVTHPGLAQIVCQVLQDRLLNADVAGQGILTVITATSLSTTYARSFWTCHAVEVVLVLTKTHSNHVEMQERCGACLEMLTGEVAPPQISFDASLLKNIVAVLIDHLESRQLRATRCPSSAVRTLYHLNQWPSCKSLLDDFRWGQKSLVVTDALWTLLASGKASERVGEAILFLFGSLISHKAGAESVSAERFQLLVGCLTKFPSYSVQVATLGLLVASFTTCQKEMPLSPEVVTPAMTKSCRVLRRNPSDAEIHKLGTQFLHHLLRHFHLQNDRKREETMLLPAPKLSRVVATVGSAMTAFPNDLCIQSEACSVLALLLQQNGTAKETVLSQGGALAIVNAVPNLLKPGVPSVTKLPCIDAVSRLPIRMLEDDQAHDVCILLHVEKAIKVEQDPEVQTALFSVLLILIPRIAPSAARTVDSKTIKDSTLTQTLALAMQNLQESPEAVRDCLGVLGKIYESSSPIFQVGGHFLRLETHTRQELATILQVMSAYKKERVIQKTCCSTLSFFISSLGKKLGAQCRDGGTERAAGARNLVASARMLSALEQSLTLFDNDAGVQRGVMVLFGTLVFVAKPEELTPFLRRIVDLIVAGMKAFAQNPSLQFGGLNAFAALFSKQVATENFDLQGVLQIHIANLERDNVALVRRAAKSLSEMLKRDGDLIFDLDELLPKLLVSMEKHGCSPVVLRTLFSVIESLMSSPKPRVRLHVANQGGLKAISFCLQGENENPELVQAACKGLAAMLSEVDMNVLWASQQPLVDGVVAALKVYKGKPKTDLAIVLSWLALCEKKEYFKAKLVKAVPFLFDTMKANTADLKLQTTACSIIRMLANYGEGGRLSGEMSAIEVLIDTLKLSIRSSAPKLAWEGLAALKMLVTEEPARDMLEPLEVEDVILRVARAHADQPAVVAEALGALNNVAADVSARTVASLHDSTLKFVLDAMHDFSRDEIVQKSCCLVLKGQVRSRSLEKLVLHGARLLPMLVEAAELFPESCAKRVQYIANRI